MNLERKTLKVDIKLKKIMEKLCYFISAKKLLTKRS